MPDDAEVDALIDRICDLTLRMADHLEAFDDARAERGGLYEVARYEKHLKLTKMSAMISRRLIERGVPADRVSGMGVGVESIRKAAPGSRRRR